MAEHAYPPQQADYAPQQTGYPPQQTGYPPQQTGYPPQQNHAYPAGAPPTYPQSTDPGVAPPVVVTTAPETTTIVGDAEPIKDYMVLAIIVTIFCFPFGIRGIIKASASRKKLSRGDVDGAREASKSARCWSIAGLIVGGIAIAIGVIINEVVKTK